MHPSNRHPAMLLAGLVAGALAVTLAGCVTSQSQQVKTRYEPGTDFASLETFRITTAAPEGGSFPNLERMAREAVDAELIERGFERADEQPADFWVELELILKGERSTRPGEDVRRSQADAEPAAAAGYSRSGTLIVRILRPKTRDVLWTGVLTGITPDPLLARDELRSAAWRLLAEYPPLGSP
jgi:hypothetical protein